MDQGVWSREVSSGGGLDIQLGDWNKGLEYRGSGLERGSEFKTGTDSLEEPLFKDAILEGIFLG